MNQPSLPVAHPANSQRYPYTPLRFAALIGLLVFSLSYAAAHWSRLEHMAMFWPVNAVVVGLLVRYNQPLSKWVWLAVATSFLLADYLAATPLLRSMIMTAGNVTQITTAFWLFQLLPDKVKQLQTSDSVIYLFFICFVSCCAGALLVTIGSTTVNEWQNLTLTSNQVLGQWLVTSLVDMTLILPVLLAWPTRKVISIENRRQTNLYGIEITETEYHPLLTAIRQALPLICLVLLLLLGVYMGGYGAIMLPIPAVLWCALSYRLFTTIVINFFVCLWQIYANTIDLYHLDFSIAQVHQAISLRLGITMLALCPIMVACIHRNNLDINAKLIRALDHDTLTQCLSRSAFFRYGNKLLSQSSAKQPLALMMLDLDHFKCVNDQFGHGIGDLALKHVVDQIQAEMRERDLFARLGGEEFAIMLKPPTYQDAMRLAERLRARVEAKPLVLANGKSLPLAISIGLVYYNSPPPLPLNVMLVVADEALYEAKRKGRNRVVATHIA